MPGPLPKRSTERRRQNKVPGEVIIEMEGEVPIPDLPKNIKGLARQWYESLKESGQSRYYEPSDWATAVLAAKTLAMALGRNGTAALLAEARHLMESLLVTESARRRVHMEIRREEPDEPKPSAADEYKQRLQVVS